MSDRRMAFPRRGLGTDEIPTITIDASDYGYTGGSVYESTYGQGTPAAPSSGIDSSSYTLSTPTTPTPARVATPTAAPAPSPFLPGTFIPTPNTLTAGAYSQAQGPNGAAFAESYTARASTSTLSKDAADFAKAVLPSLFAAGGQVGAIYLATQQPKLAASGFNLVPSPSGGYVQKPAAAPSSGPGIGTVVVGGLGLGYLAVKLLKGRGR